MEGHWVGTWRPHPRRGPILAEFSTPGPKYGLPGTTGHPGHDPTMERAPAYSFRGTKYPSAATCSPGPRYSIDASITKTGKHVPPTALVTARPKTKIAVTPGPSDYTTEPANKHVYHSAPANSMFSRPKDSKAFQTPGPGSYSLPKVMGPRTASTPAAPCYSMIWKSQYQSCFQDLAKTPGPAAFSKVDLDVYKPKAPKYTMRIKTDYLGKSTVPGPAEYSLGMVSVTKKREPAYSFGIRHSAYETSLVCDSNLD